MEDLLKQIQDYKSEIETYSATDEKAVEEFRIKWFFVWVHSIPSDSGRSLVLVLSLAHARMASRTIRPWDVFRL